MLHTTRHWHCCFSLMSFHRTTVLNLQGFGRASFCGGCGHRGACENRHGRRSGRGGAQNGGGGRPGRASAQVHADALQRRRLHARRSTQETAGAGPRRRAPLRELRGHQRPADGRPVRPADPTPKRCLFDPRPFDANRLSVSSLQLSSQ